ncbi:TipAS antibiotic-recognition domain-containing protein [Thalassomonas sp. M1454]|uniref:TipAS antibiotic-recognition domain-containing protein n=1 Tax=Thalassomonas sp. M1454 TaxID=2594477 RepID=UPI00117BF9CA|nr:TipAS antibiotic-recognition domain-containing protein [Thalassomonas sp. M1454]TRX55861.1 hypothetical protein FNN08_09595 [Thalassomonas sp. M1454]
MSSNENDNINQGAASEDLEKWEKISRERVGDEKVDERLEQLAKLSMEETLELKAQADELNLVMAKTLGMDITSDEVQAVVKQYLDYTEMALSKLQNKEVVVDYDRFIAFANSIANDDEKRAAFEFVATGLADHFSKAMLHYAEQNLK